MATNRVVGPAEYKQIAKQNKVTPRNFDQYFMRQGKNIVYRDQATNPTTGTTEAAAGVAQEAKPQHEIFGNAIMDLLKQYQGIEKYPYAKQGFNAQQEQINRIQASPDQSMVGASPEQQNAVRGAGVSAVQPTVSGAEGAGQTFASRLNTFGDILGQARGLQQQMEQSAQQAKADARTLINNAFATTGGSEFLNMNPKELASLEKTAGLPKDYIHNTVQAIKAREEKLKQEELKSRAPQTMETSGGIFQWNSSTGRWEATGLRGYHAPTGGGGGGGLIGEDPSVDAFADLILSGDMEITAVPAKYRAAVVKKLSQTPTSEQPKQTFEQFVQDEQNKAGQSFTPEKIASLKKQFESQQQNTSSNIFSLNRGGKKPTTDSIIKPLQKSMSVINQLSDLQKSIDKTLTDPFIGQLKKLNPYDFDARAIQAQLQAVVPNLARGVYGEVGVLTDNDIKNYIQTLPNIISTDDQNKFVMGMTLRTVARGYETQLETLSAAGYDVSGFKNQYDKLQNTVSGIEKSIGVKSTQNQSSQPQNGNSSYNDYLKAIGQ